MDPLSPVKKSSLAALAQKAVSRPNSTATARETPGAKQPSAKGTQSSREAFQSLDLRRTEISKRAERSSQPASSPNTVIERSNKPQIFTLQSLSAMAGMLVAELEGSVPGGQAGKETSNISADEKSGPNDNKASDGPPKHPGSKLNISV